MTYDQFVQTYGEELGECLYFCGLMSGDGSVVLENLAPVQRADKPVDFLNYSW